VIIAQKKKEQTRINMRVVKNQTGVKTMLKRTVLIASLNVLLALFFAEAVFAQCNVEAYFSPYDDVEEVIVKRPLTPI